MGVGRTFYFICFVAFPQLFFGQDNLVKDEMLWTSFGQQMSVTEKLSVKLEWHHRWISSGTQHWMAPRISGVMDVNKHLQIEAGFLHFGIVNQVKSESRDLALQTEYRPHQALIYKISIGRARLSQQFKTEQRMFRNLASEGAIQEDDFYWRLRYELSVHLPLATLGNTQIGAAIAEEFMLNAGHSRTNRAFDQNRIFAGMAFKFNPHLTTKIGYMHWLQQPITGDFLIARHSIRISVVHSFGLKAN